MIFTQRNEDIFNCSSINVHLHPLHPTIHRGWWSTWREGRPEYFTVWIVNKRRKESGKFNFKLCKSYEKENYWYHQFWFCFFFFVGRSSSHTKPLHLFPVLYALLISLLSTHIPLNLGFLFIIFFVRPSFISFSCFAFMLCACHSCFFALQAIHIRSVKCELPEFVLIYVFTGFVLPPQATAPRTLDAILLTISLSTFVGWVWRIANGWNSCRRHSNSFIAAWK